MATEDVDLSPSYKELQKIGEGAYGTVFKAIHGGNGHVVAIKKILMDSEGVPGTCLREISVLKEMKHPNVIHLFDVILEWKSLYLVFEFVQRDLDQLLESLPNRRVPYIYVQSFMYQLLDGLAYTHSHRILHRDLKPQNVLVTDSGVVKLADFGLARIFAIPSREYTNMVVTLWYRPPEILLGSKEYSTALDIWSVGCIFVEMSIGRTPFPGDSEIDQLFQIFEILGTPNRHTWADVEHLVNYKAQFPKWVFVQQKLDDLWCHLGPEGIPLAQNLLKYCPDQRVTARDAMNDVYFRKKPMQLPSISLLMTHGHYTSISASNKAGSLSLKKSQQNQKKKIKRSRKRNVSY